MQIHLVHIYVTALLLLCVPCRVMRKLYSMALWLLRGARWVSGMI